jgi:hypothetical protein
VRILCLDSNHWMRHDGQDQVQYRWLESQLRQPSAATWTFVAFHHPLFSAHATRPIEPLRWEWAPLLLDPRAGVDALLTGHDHFYARNWPMARLAAEPVRGTWSLTTGGGGAPLYAARDRGYVAHWAKAHHFTLFEIDDDRLTLTAISETGEILDRFDQRKGPTPNEQFCAYEVEELRRSFEQAIEQAGAVTWNTDGSTRIDRVLEVANPFRIPVTGKWSWKPADGWEFPTAGAAFALQPGQPFRLPVQAVVASRGKGVRPSLVIEFDTARFVNRLLEIQPVP